MRGNPPLARYHAAHRHSPDMTMRILLFIAAALLAATAAAQTTTRTVDIPTRPGVTQRFIVITPEKPKAAAILFALAIRGFSVGPLTVPELGLVVAAPLAIIAAGLADKDARIGELVIFAAVLTAFCIGVFRYALGLSIPVAPWLIGY